MNLKYFVFYLLFFLTAFWVAETKAQPQKDFEALLNIDIEKKISPSFSVDFLNQNALNQNASELGYSFFDAGLSCRITRNISLSAHYRFIQFRNLENFYDDRQMIYADAQFAKGKNNFLFSFRTRYQRLFYGDQFSDQFKPWRDYNRNKFQIRYRVNYNWSPFVSAEFFYPVNIPTRKLIDQWRETAGIYYTFNDYFKLEGSYSFQQLINRKNKINYYVASLTFYYRF